MGTERSDPVLAGGRVLFALGLAGFGLVHVASGEFVAGRAPPWPEGVAGGTAWAFATGAFLVASGVAILLDRRARPLAVAAGSLILAWAFLRQLAPTAAGPPLGPQWTNAGKALVFSAGAFTVAGTATPGAGRTGPRLRRVRNVPVLLGRGSLSLFLVVCGIQHFIYDEFVASLVPAWIPAAYFWTYFAGVALIAGGAGLLLDRTAPLAAALSGLMVFSWVWLVHVPRIASHGGWLPPFEALAVSGLALILCRAIPAARVHPVQEVKPQAFPASTGSS